MLSGPHRAACISKKKKPTRQPARLTDETSLLFSFFLFSFYNHRVARALVVPARLPCRACDYSCLCSAKHKREVIHKWVVRMAGCDASIDTSRLSTLAETTNTSCHWICAGGNHHCVHPDDIHLPAIKAMAMHGREWEAGCKAWVRANVGSSLRGKIAVAAGLFFGDWLAPLATLVGSQGRVVGFEPTERVHQARATNLANGHRNVDIVHACLSNVASTASMCIRGRDGKPNYPLGGRSALLTSGAVETRNVRFRSCTRLANVTCDTIDNLVPWSKWPVGLVLLDVSS
jgi:hypothetical protein